MTGTEASATIEPVIFPQLVDLDPFATVGRLKLQRHDRAGKGGLHVTPGVSRMSVRRGNECWMRWTIKWVGKSVVVMGVGGR
jgi:hypothetical protein